MTVVMMRQMSLENSIEKSEKKKNKVGCNIVSYSSQV